MRLIDADVLKESIENIVSDEMKIDDKWATGLRYALKLIDNAPTVEYTFEESFQKTVCETGLYCKKKPKGEFECCFKIKDLISVLLEYDMNEKATIYTDENNIVIIIKDTSDKETENDKSSNND